MVKTKEAILIHYQNQIQSQQNKVENLVKKLNQVSLSRLGVFIAEILIVALIISQGYHWIMGLLLCIPVLIFMVLVKKQVSLQGELRYARKLLWVYQNEEHHLLDRKNGYDDGAQYQDEHHPYTSDLDVFGPLSLYATLNRCKTTRGMDLLARHLEAPLERTVILERQEGIEELNKHIEDTFHFRAQLQNHEASQLGVIEHKLAHELELQLRFIHAKLLRTYVAFVPFLTIGLLIIGSFMGGIWWNLLGLVAIFNAGLTFFNLKAINQVYYGFSGGAELLRAFSGTIEWTERVQWKSKYIRDFFQPEGDSTPVSRQIKRLSSIIQAFDARLNIIVSSFLNLFFLWDLRCTVRLDKWYAGSSAHILKGLYRISQFEELISFATLNYNEPAWVYPQIQESFALEALNLGHPLIEDGKRIVNSYSLSEKPTVDIVTGSNMAGKSTFLRTVGVNMVLAFSGGPVCAEALSLSIFNVLSYMRIKDSLNDQTSTFKAELNRLKMILDSTRIQRNSFVLIDEMLRGTNSRDKYLGSKVFIEKMIEQQTPALFATHDLQLSEMESEYSFSVRNYHFDIQIADGEMHFDYKLKHGACKTFNAAILLKQIGLSLKD